MNPLKQEIFISILLPTYNRAELLNSCIRSVLDQSYRNWELIVYDDASTDCTKEIVKTFLDKTKNIRYIRSNRNCGLPKIRNKAIKASSYNLIFFIEDDLILDHNCVKMLMESYMDLKRKGFKIGAVSPRLITCYDNYPFLLSCPNKIDKIKMNVQSFEISSFDPLTGSLRYNYNVKCDEIKQVVNVHACSLYEKNALVEIGGYDENAYKGNYAYEDIDLNFRLRKKKYALFFNSEAVAYHYMAAKGGCRNKNYLHTLYFQYRNHMVFVMKNFGFRSVYMLPLFFLNLMVHTLMYIIIRSKQLLKSLFLSYCKL